MPSNQMTNEEVVEFLGLPSDIITSLQSKETTTYTPALNEFINAVVNKIVYQKVDSFGYENPFKKYDGFPVNYGDTIENIFVELPQGYEFDKDATDPFAKVAPSTKPLYAKINYTMQYALTIQDTLLRRACLNEYGFMNLIETLLGSLSKAKSIDEYFATLGMLNNADIYANGFEEVDVVGQTDDVKAKTITSEIVDVVSAFQLPSKTNNKSGVLTASKSSDILLIIKRPLYNSINLDFLTGVYNLSKVDLINNIIVVDSFQVENPQGQAQGTDIDFVILDTNGFDNHIALEDSGMIYNPKGKYTNHFTNLWKIIAFKYYFNARAFKLKTA